MANGIPLGLVLGASPAFNTTKKIVLPRAGDGSAAGEPAISTANAPFVTPAYEAPEQLDGKLVAEVKAVFVERVSHAGGIMTPGPEERVYTGDRGALLGAPRSFDRSQQFFLPVRAGLKTAHSRIPALSYGVRYAIGKVILGFGGSLMVRLIGPG